MKLNEKKVKILKEELSQDIKWNFDIIPNFPAKDLIIKIHVDLIALVPFEFINLDRAIRNILEKNKMYIGKTVTLKEEWYDFFNDKPY